jgi:GxxExxY protein
VKGVTEERERMPDVDLIYPEETYAIRGAVFDVYRVTGCGFLEGVYQECMEKEFTCRGIPFVSQQDLKICYKGDELKQRYKPDLICYGKIMVELKAVTKLAPEHKAQLMNYLHATKMRLGLLVNFGHYPLVEIERIAH